MAVLLKFVKYRSIENSYRIRMLEKIAEEGKDKQQYVVTEKVHGANFSFWCDGNEVKCGKRSAILKNDANFFNFQQVLGKHFMTIMKLWQSFNFGFNAQILTIYGELHGGRYPHPDVEPVKHVGGIQKEVYYSPDIEFYAFDIMWDGKFLNVDDFEKIMTMSDMGLTYAKRLYTGTLEQCLKYPNEFQTTIPREYGLPSIEGNICEGVVIKPVIYTELIDGTRVILKNKNPKVPLQVSEVI